MHDCCSRYESPNSSLYTIQYLFKYWSYYDLKHEVFQDPWWYACLIPFSDYWAGQKSWSFGVPRIHLGTPKHVQFIQSRFRVKYHWAIAKKRMINSGKSTFKDTNSCRQSKEGPFKKISIDKRVTKEVVVGLPQELRKPPTTWHSYMDQSDYETYLENQRMQEATIDKL